MTKYALVVFLLTTGLALGFSGEECFTYASTVLGKKVRYCIDRNYEMKGMARHPVIYFFHGMGGSSQSYDDNGYKEVFQSLSKTEHFPKATVISFDTEAKSFFSDFGDVHSGPRAYETWFLKEFMPEMEKRYNVCNEASCRLLLGLSMGGYGALKMALKHQGEFASVAVNCPALPPFNIYDSDTRWLEYFNRHPIGPLQGGYLLEYLRQMFPSYALFEENDPISLVRQRESTESLPALYFDVGGKDYFGFQEGFFELEIALKEKVVAFTSYYDPNADHDIFRARRWEAMRFLAKQLPSEPEITD